MLRRIRLEDWGLLRDIRLRALAESPRAFPSRLEDQERLPDAWWQDSVTRLVDDAVGLVAADGDRWIGLVRVYPEPDDASVFQLMSMWVDPSARRRGVGRVLVDGALDWARQQGGRRMILWVYDGNRPAVTFYESCGFAPTGERTPHASDPSLDEIRMQIDLRA